MGVDVGGERKGFDVAVIDHTSLIHLRARLTCAQVVEIAAEVEPRVIGIDSPRCCAPEGSSSRECERMLAREVCGIRWTPDAAAVNAGDYYGWIVHGLELHSALQPLGADVIEVFPTAAWTRWLGRKGAQPRSAWTRGGLTKLGLSMIPKRTNQDQRDAIAAAVTARQHSQGTTQAFGDIVVPAAGR